MESVRVYQLFVSTAEPPLPLSSPCACFSSAQLLHTTTHSLSDATTPTPTPTTPYQMQVTQLAAHVRYDFALLFSPLSSPAAAAQPQTAQAQAPAASGLGVAPPPNCELYRATESLALRTRVVARAAVTPEGMGWG